MIVIEYITIREREFVRTYSDAGRYVVRDGVTYSEAIDPFGTGRVYTEGDIMPDEENTNTATAADYEAALAEFGVRV